MADRTLRRQWFARINEPLILLPAIAVVGLLMIWAGVFRLVDIEETAARRAAAASSKELAATYEAQTMRALREIDQTLKFVKYVYERHDRPLVLDDLKEKGLLPPDSLFVVTITNSDGDVIASTRPGALYNVGERDYFLSLRRADALAVGMAEQRPGKQEWRLPFARRLSQPDGAFAGVVAVEVDAAYFVSGFEADRLGRNGVLALLGTDGIFRALRSGDRLLTGQRVDYVKVVPGSAQAQGGTVLATDPWDGVRRFTSARALPDFPLAVVVGLSQQEQLAKLSVDLRTRLMRAAFVSLMLLLVTALLGRKSWQLEQSRKRAVQENLAHAARVEYLAFHDGLTTLPNRSLFAQVLAQAIAGAARYKRQLAVVFLDLDRFKLINDTLGHEAGDELLKEVATRLKGCLRASDTVARLGGDEFVVLLPELDEEKYVATVAQKILAALARPFALGGQELRVTASIGIATYPQDGLDEQTLTKNADIAMYQAKAEGKNNFQFFSDKLRAGSLERMTLESGLRTALERQEFALHYQAKRDIQSGCITGMEALLRWQHPELGMVAPLQFIPLAEETRLMVPIGRWVIRTACAQNMEWQRQGLPDLSMAVNLSAIQLFDEHLLDDLDTILIQTGMPPRLLELEIAETLLMHDVPRTIGILSALKQRGIRIAIDEFGLGYSSLSTLQQFPLDTIKIDRSFIRAMASPGEDTNLTDAIVALGRSLSLTVVAQGVETREQADYLRSNGIGELQGFYLNKPQPADTIADLLRAQPESGERNADSAT
ncbi:MAG: EAL domain-containing protein [Burkholderiaceae bacterium]